MKKKILLLLISLFILIPNAYANTKKTVKFSKCVDGDTAVFLIDKEKVRIRFLAIDTPETVHPTKSVEAYGKNASEYTCSKLTNAKKIVLEYDDKSTKQDKYGRTLAWVWVDGSLLQKELIEVGYAQVKYVYGKYSYLDELYEVEEKAKEKELGLWSNYKEKTYIVTFKYNDKEKKVKVNENEVVESFTPEKSGYNFSGWYLNDKKFDFDTKITSNITLKAKFEKENTVLEIIAIVLLLLAYYLVDKKGFKRKIKKIIK